MTMNCEPVTCNVCAFHWNSMCTKQV